MKKILSFVLAAVMLMSMLVVSASAAGSVIFADDFEMGFKPANWIQGESCAFSWDSANKCIVGYGTARVLQTNYDGRDPKIWDKFYASYDFQIRGFDDLVPATNTHKIGIWVRDQFENESGTQGAVYTFNIEIDGKNEDGSDSATSRAYVDKDLSFNYRDENNILQEGRVSGVIAETEIDTKIEVGENAPYYEIGVRITEGKLEFYFEQELIFSFEAKEDDEKLGHIAINNVDATMGTQRTPVLFLASIQGADLYTAVDNFRVMTPDYDFNDVLYGDVNSDSKINLADVSAMLKKIAKWEVSIDETAADVDANGKVNLADVSLVLKHIAKWDVVLGSK